MAKISLVPHNLMFAKRMFELVTAPEVRVSIDIRDRTVEETKWFIVCALEEEKAGTQVSRVILNEQSELIGVTSLTNIDREKKQCHLGTWLGVPYWGKGYNQAAKAAILQIAFEELGMNVVLMGARKRNLRSQMAQVKLPYVTVGAEGQFAEELHFLEEREREDCVLNAVYREDFLQWLKSTQGESV